MNSRMIGLAALGAAMLTACAGRAMGQTGRVYHLRAGSTEQRGCFGLCACWLGLERPLRGTFVLTPSGSDMWTQFFTVSGVNWRSAWYQDVFAGSGTYQVGGDFALTQRMALNLTVGGQAAQQWDSGTRVIVQGPYFPAIAVRLSFPQTVCYDIVLNVRATPLTGDWDGDGHLSVQDVFAFLSSWFEGDGDANEDGVTNVQDVFDFVGAWFAGT